MSTLRASVAAAGLAASFWVTACGGGGGAASSGSTGAAAKGPSVEGETLTPRVIPDAQQGGMPVGVVAVPASWTFNSDVQWNYAHHSNPVTVSSRAENPANDEAV